MVTRPPPKRPRPQLKRRASFRPRLLPLLGVAFFIVVALLWLLPPLFDWQLQRGTIEAAASGFLGREVRIKGAIRVSLLPQPSITAEKVEVRDSGDGARMSAPRLTLALSLGALLTGRLDVSHVALDDADIRLPWPLPHGPLSLEPPPWLASLSAEVNNAHIAIGPLTLDNASFDVATGGPAGAVQLDGSTTLAKRGWNLSLSLGWPRGDGSAPLKATMQNADGPAASFAFTGIMRSDSRLAGRFDAHGETLASLLPTPGLPFDGHADLTADRDRVTLSGLRLTLGDQSALGKFVMPLPHGRRATPPGPSELDLHLSLLDLTPWLAAIGQGTGDALPVRLDLSADAATYGGGLLRDLDMLVMTGADRIRIDRASATLPGESPATLAGFYEPRTGRFLGKAQITAPSPAATLHWLAQAKLLPGAEPAAAMFSDFALKGDLLVTPHRVVMTGLTGALNGSQITGGFSATRGAQPAVAATLSFDKLDLGLWLPSDWLDAPPSPRALAHSIEGLTTDLRISARQAWIGGTEIDQAVLDAATQGGTLTLRRLGGRMQGMQFIGSGTLAPNGGLTDGRLVLSAQPAAKLERFAPPALRRAASFWNAPLMAVATASGPPERLAVTLDGTIGDLSLSAQPVIDMPHRLGHGTFTLRHPSASRLLNDLGFASAGDWLGAGSLSVVAEAETGGGAWRVAPVTFSLGLVHGGGNLGYSGGRAPDERGITGHLAIDTLPWPDPAPGQPLPIDLLSGWQAAVDLTIAHVIAGMSPVADDVAATADIGHDALALTVRHARVLGGTLAGTARLEIGAPPRVTADATLTDAALAPPLSQLPMVTASHVDATLKATMQGYSLDAWLSSMGGTLSATSGEATLSGVDLAALAHPAASAKDGHTVFTAAQLEAVLRQGEIHLTTLTATGASGSLAAKGDADLVRGTCNLQAVVTPSQPGAAPFTILAQGLIRAPNQTLLRGASPAQ